MIELYTGSTPNRWKAPIESLALNGANLSNDRSVRFMGLARLDTAEAGAGTDEPRKVTEKPQLIFAAINDNTPANPELRRSGSRFYGQIC